MRSLHALLAATALGALAVGAPRIASAQAAATMPPASMAPSGNPMTTASPPGQVNPMESGFASAPASPNPFASPTSTPSLMVTEPTASGGGGSWGLLGLLGLLGLIGLRGSSRPAM
jgi:hypothetical protein